MHNKIVNSDEFYFPFRSTIHYFNINTTPTVPSSDLHIFNLNKYGLVYNVKEYHENTIGKFKLEEHKLKEERKLKKNTGKYKLLVNYKKNNKVRIKDKEVMVINYGMLNYATRYKTDPLNQYYRYINDINYYHIDKK